jgi:SOS response regulatory protein OraA/RecX
LRPRSRTRFPSRADLSQGSADDAVQAALRLLRHRDRSVAQLERELEARGVGAELRAEALATLLRTGLVDDVRFAESRARGLAERGAGDRLIRHELEAAGVPLDAIEDAIGALEPESDRAAGIVVRRGASAKTARYLAGKGFGDDVVSAVVARAGDEALG